MPDVFVPMDTMRLSDYFIACRSKGLQRQFAHQWADGHRGAPEVKDFDTYLRFSDSLGIDSLFEVYAAENKVVRDTAKEQDDPARVKHSDEYQHVLLKGLVAEQLFGLKYYYLVMKEVDNGYQSAITTLRVSPLSMRTK